jgi:hypothetical protein
MGAIFRLVYGYLAETINFANEVNGVTEKKAKSGNQIAYLIFSTFLFDDYFLWF